MSWANAGILDYHMVLALKQGWRNIYAPSSSLFSGLFTGVSQAVINTWFAALKERDGAAGVGSGLQIRLDGSRGELVLPAIIVRLENETMTMVPFGTKTVIGGDLVHPYLMAQRAVVEVRARTPEVCRALAVVVRSILHLAREEFVRDAKYTNFLFESGGGLSPEEQFIAEQSGLSGVSLYRLYYTAECHGAVKDPVGLPVPIQWFVQHEDSKTVDGLPGGVVPLPQP